MNPSSCIYVGHVVHHRLRPRAHHLRYRAFWILIDLDEIHGLSSKLLLFSRNRLGLIGFFDRDHGDGSTVPLRTQAEALLRNASYRPDDVATIKLLCMPRIMGYGFNPLSVYFCYRLDNTLEAIIYEVHNTYGERHTYVLPGRGATSQVKQSCNKEFFVSPFLSMDMSYTFHVSLADAHVSIAIDGEEKGEPVIVASLSGKRHELSDAALLRALITHPLLTMKVVLAIHWHAFRLVLKGFHVHKYERQTCRPTTGHSQARSK